MAVLALDNPIDALDLFGFFWYQLNFDLHPLI